MSVKRKSGVNFEAHNLAYLDGIRSEAPYSKISRSALVNLIIEEHAKSHGVILQVEEGSFGGDRGESDR